MAIEIDHYEVLGLPSWEEGANLSQKQISEAYKKMALKLHPDKNKDDPHANENFRKLKDSFEFLKDEAKRKLFHDYLLRKRWMNKRPRLANTNKFSVPHHRSSNSAFCERHTDRRSDSDVEETNPAAEMERHVEIWKEFIAKSRKKKRSRGSVDHGNDKGKATRY